MPDKLKKFAAPLAAADFFHSLPAGAFKFLFRHKRCGLITDPVGVVITNIAMKAQEYNDDAYAFEVLRDVFPPLLPFAKYVGGVAGFFSGVSQLITDGLKKPEYLTHNS